MEKKKGLLAPYKGLPKEVYIIFLARIINAAGLFVFPLLTLLLTRKIGLSEGEAGLWITISGIAFMGSSLIGGKITDKFGRKKIIVTCDIIGIIGFVACAFMEPSMMMCYTIILTGAIMGAADPAHTALLSDLTTPENRDGAFSLTYYGFNIGFAIGPMIGSFLFEKNLKLFFLIDAATALIAVILVILFIKETFASTKEDLGKERALEKNVEGSVFKVLKARPILLYFSLIFIGYNFVYAQWGFLYPLHTAHNFGADGTPFYGMLASLNGAVVMVFTPLITKVFSKKSNMKNIFYGGILYVIGFGMLGFISTKVAFALSILIFTLGEILVTISAMPFLANHTPASHRGRVNSVLPLLMGLGYTFSPIITGGALKHISIDSMWKIVGGIMIISVLGILKLEKSEKETRVVDEEEDKMVGPEIV